MTRLIERDTLGIITVWQEARGESYEGKIAVAEVIQRRMLLSRKEASEIVLAKYQFSGWNTEDPNRIPSVLVDDDNEIVQDCVLAWEQAKRNPGRLSNGATHYMNKELVLKWYGKLPAWVNEMEEVAQVGEHTFYRKKA